MNKKNRKKMNELEELILKFEAKNKTESKPKEDTFHGFISRNKILIEVIIGIIIIGGLFLGMAFLGGIDLGED